MADVLLVEDEPDHAAFLTAKLTGSGHRVVTFDNGLTAWRRLQTSLDTPDVIVADWAVEGLDGLELFARCGDDPTLCDVPFVLISAHAMPHHRAEVTAAGVEHFLTKPFSTTRIAELVARLATTPGTAT